MNDFTKEELEWLEEELRYSLEEFQQPKIAYVIHKKVQSMIEDYCQHQYHNTKISKHWMCDTCGKHCGYITAEQLQNDNQ